MLTRRRCVLGLALVLVLWLIAVLASGPPAFVEAAAQNSGAQTSPSVVLPIEELSPGFLGVYRKVMEIEDEILEYSRKYDVDPVLARAVCMYESGGNAGLASSAGAQGYFQVMGPTFRALRVPTNIEAVSFSSKRSHASSPPRLGPAQLSM